MCLVPRQSDNQHLRTTELSMERSEVSELQYGLQRKEVDRGELDSMHGLIRRKT